MSRLNRKLAVAVAFATCAAGVLGACGDDDPENDASTTDAPTTAAAAPSPGEGPTDLAAFCDPYVDTTLMISGEPDPAALTENNTLIVDNAPAEIAESAKVMTEAVTQVLESGGEDFSAFETPEFTEAQAQVDPFVFENCEFDTALAVKGVDFGFTGLPETVDAGRVAILFTNEGAEAHEIAVMRRKDGVTESFEELLSLPEEEAMGKVTPVGGAFAPTTDSRALLVGNFEPGDYIAICFVPTGTTMSDGAMTEGSGAPHFAHGMQQEFTVS